MLNNISEVRNKKELTKDSSLALELRTLLYPSRTDFSHFFVSSEQWKYSVSNTENGKNYFRHINTYASQKEACKLINDGSNIYTTF